MIQAEHSPTPWRLTVRGIEDANGMPVDEDRPEFDGRPLNEEFIVCAVNAHDTLVASMAAKDAAIAAAIQEIKNEWLYQLGNFRAGPPHPRTIPEQGSMHRPLMDALHTLQAALGGAS